MNNEWHFIPDYNERYLINKDGIIKSVDYYRKSNFINTKECLVKGKTLKSFYNRDGYVMVYPYKDGKKKTELLHRLVAKTFIKNENCYNEINHKDGNKINNNVDNLEWCDRSYNIQYFSKNFLVGSSKRKTQFQPVNQYDKQGKFIKRWDTIVEAEKSFKTNHIAECCRKKYHFIKGYRWEYANK
jgi:hypothetical protein